MDVCILWDLDGTLLDTLEDLTDATNYALRAHGYPECTRDEIRKFVGNGAENQIRCSLPKGVPVQPVLETYQAYYTAHCNRKTGPYPHIREVLDSIRERYAVAIVSNKPDAAVKALCRTYFPGIPAIGETPNCPRKPDPTMLLRGMEAFQAARCIYVGDSEVDILTAKNAGMVCLSVLWGFRDKEELIQAGGTHFCDTPEDLAERIEELIHGK